MVENPDQSVVRDESGGESQRPGRKWSIAGIVLGGLAFLIIPFLLGPLGMLFGFIGFTRGARRLGAAAIIVSVTSLVLGTLMYILLQNMMSQS
ncbi:hypothetical protein BH23ACT11_BH23ACT11_17820 [soil metagenome]